MSSLKNISLFHFKNYEQQTFLFEKEVVCLIGKNGVGKTSTLDAIYYLCFTKSYFVSNDSHCIKNGTQGMFIKGQFDDEREVKCIIRENGKKEFSCDEEVYSKLSSHIGKYSCVMIAPDDTQLITEGSELRRKFLDGMIAQIDPVYLQHISSYAKLLVQRNAYLKSCKGEIPVDLTLLKLYNEQLNHHAEPIVMKRKFFVEKLIEEATHIYQVLANDIEEIKIEYDSKLLNDSLLNLLETNLFKDVVTARTNYGIHKDDLAFTMNGMPLKQVASQGQRKSFLFALKLAQYQLLHQYLAQKPILLLDDIFEKLDESRSEKLIQYVKGLHTQLFITDTQKHRVQKECRDFEQDIQFVEIV